MPVALVYLGREGAGKSLTKELLSLEKYQIAIVTTKISHENLDVNYATPIIELPIKKNLFSYLWNFVFPKKYLSEIVKSLESCNIDKVIFPMVTPFDFQLIKMLDRIGIAYTTIIHDPSRHKGDFWPPSFVTQYIVKNANKIVCLSDYTKNELKLKYFSQTPIISVSHPAFNFRDFREGQKISESIIQKDYILFIGRFRKYKGIKFLIKAWNRCNFDNRYLLIAGDGRLFIPKRSRTNIIVFNEWINEELFYELILRSKGVVFPYLEASQSGVLPIVMSANKPVIVTNVGGLVEQSEQYSKRLVVERPFKQNLVNALNMVWSFSDELEPPFDFKSNKSSWEKLSTLLLKDD